MKPYVVEDLQLQQEAEGGAKDCLWAVLGTGVLGREPVNWRSKVVSDIRQYACREAIGVEFCRLSMVTDQSAS